MEQKNLHFKGAWVWYTLLFSFFALPVSVRYVDGAGHFTYCHFWAHHAALGGCEDNWSWWHPEGQSSLQRSTEMWVTADIGSCGLEHLTLATESVSFPWEEFWGQMHRLLSCCVFALCSRFLYFDSLLLLLSGLLAVSLFPQKGLRRRSVCAIGIAAVISLHELSNV